jgi:hypothetical protein
MAISLKRTLLSNTLLKVLALILGYTLWSILGETFPTTRWFKVPLCFYNTQPTKSVTAPETLWVQLKGRRSALNTLDSTNLAVHVDAQHLKVGPNGLALTAEHLLLPSPIALQEYTPQNILITVT